LSSQDIALIKF